MDHKHSFESSVVMFDVVIQFVGTSANSDQNVILSDAAGKFLGANQIHFVIFGVLNNWNSHIVSLNYLLNVLVNLVTFSWLEPNGSLSEKLITLLI